MNVMNMWKSTTFMPYPFETKGCLNVMNVVRKYLLRAHAACQPQFANELRDRDSRLKAVKI